MYIKKSSLETLVAKLAAVDKVSRRKNLTGEDMALLNAEAIKAVRAALTVLRKASKK